MSNDSSSLPHDPQPEPKEPRRSPINPFDAARMRRSAPDIQVCWSADDMQILRPDWTADQCESFMRRHASQFAAGMIRMGLAVLTTMVDDPKFTNHHGPVSGNGENRAQSPPPDSENS